MKRLKETNVLSHNMPSDSYQNVKFVATNYAQLYSAPFVCILCFMKFASYE